ncbi:MAG: BON domain-containing protein [Thermodesulfobacteriota bacterium]
MKTGLPWRGMPRFMLACGLAALLGATTGCTPAVVAGGAVGGYKVATDDRSAGTVLDDATITTRVNAAMIGDSEVKARDIDVDTVAGVVTLTGNVDSRREAERAVALARKVDGVRQVKNELRVGSRTAGQVMDDEVIGAKVKAKLMEAPGIRSLNIDVDVYSARVALTGTVPDKASKKKVLRLVRSVAGVKDVVDNLQVR